jgi:hypothetical protein
MKRVMSHPRKRPRTKGEGKEIRDPTTLVLSIMITYPLVASSPSVDDQMWQVWKNQNI